VAQGRSCPVSIMPVGSTCARIQYSASARSTLTLCRDTRVIDRLPADIVDPFNEALVRSLERDELDRALGRAVAALIRESAEAGEMVANLEGQLRELASGSVG